MSHATVKFVCHCGQEFASPLLRDAHERRCEKPANISRDQLSAAGAKEYAAYVRSKRKAIRRTIAV